MGMHSGDLLAEAEIHPRPQSSPVKGLRCQQRRAAAVLRGIGPADQPARVEVRHPFQQRLPLVPVNIQPVALLHRQQPLQGGFLLPAVGHKAVPAWVPLDIVPVLRLPGGEDLQAVLAQHYLGRVGMGGAHPADGGLVGALPGAGSPLQHQHLQPALCQRQGVGIPTLPAPATMAS